MAAQIPSDDAKYNPYRRPGLNTYVWTSFRSVPKPKLTRPTVRFDPAVPFVDPVNGISGASTNFLDAIGTPGHNEYDEWQRYSLAGPALIGVPAGFKQSYFGGYNTRGNFRSEAWDQACLLRYDPVLCG